MIKILNLVASLLATTTIFSGVINGVISKTAIPTTKLKTLPPEGTLKTTKYFTEDQHDFYVDISFSYQGLMSIENDSHFSSSNGFYNFLTNYEGSASGKVSWWAHQGTALHNAMNDAYGEGGLRGLQDLVNGTATSSPVKGWPSFSQNHIYYYDKFIFGDFKNYLEMAIQQKQGLFWTMHFVAYSFSYNPYAAAAYFPILTNPSTPKFNQASYKRGASKRTSSRDIDVYKYYAYNAFKMPELPSFHTFGYTLDLSWKSVQYLIGSHDKLASRFPASRKWAATGGFIDYLMDQPYTEYRTPLGDGWDLSNYINADADSYERGHFVPDVVYSYLGQRNPESIANKMWTIVKNAWDSFETININFYSDFLYNNSVITWFSLENPYNHQICVSNAI